jgi:hypothetical protein
MSGGEGIPEGLDFAVVRWRRRFTRKVNAQFSARELRFSNFKPFLNGESITPDFEAAAEIEGSVSAASV